MYIHPVQFIILLTILLAALLGRLFYLRLHARKLQLSARVDEQELQQIRQRVQVLERIATDGESTLEREIEALRGA